MRRLASYLSVAALTFCIGSSAQMLRPGSSSTPAHRQPLSLSLCDLMASPERYDGEEVQVRAVLYRNGGEPFISDSSCASEAARVPVQEDAHILTSRGLPVWATYTTFCGNDPYPATVDGLAADVIIVGTFKSGFAELNDGSAMPGPIIISNSYVQISRGSRRQ